MSGDALEALAAEIARIEAEIARRTNVDDPATIEDDAMAIPPPAIAQSPTPVSPRSKPKMKKKKVIKRIVRRRRPSQKQGIEQEVKEQEPARTPHVRMSRRASYLANPDLDVTEFHRQQLQLEIQEIQRLHDEQRRQQALYHDQHDDDDEDSVSVELVAPQPLQQQQQQQQQQMHHNSQDLSFSPRTEFTSAGRATDQNNVNDAQRQLEAEIAALQEAIAGQSVPKSPSRSRKQSRRRSAPRPSKPTTVSFETTAQSIGARLCGNSSQPQLEQTEEGTTMMTTERDHLHDHETNASVQSKCVNYKQCNTKTNLLEVRHVDSNQLPSGSLPIMTDLAAEASQAAQCRSQRLDSGGDLIMTQTGQLQEDGGDEKYKRAFRSIVQEAAELGRLTRLPERVVEAIAHTKTPEQEWKSQGLLAISWQSNFMSIVQEAANVGNEIKLPEHVVGNDESSVSDNETPVMDASSPGPGGLENRQMSERMQQLLELDQTVGHGLHKVDRIMKVRRQSDKDMRRHLVQPMGSYQDTIDNIVLPRERPPIINPKKASNRLAEDDRPMIDIARYVATAAWERRARLDRPNMVPKIREKCPCIYCYSASPYQTYAYKLQEQYRKEKGHDAYDSGPVYVCRELPRDKSVVSVDCTTINPRRAKAFFAKRSLSAESLDEGNLHSSENQLPRPANDGKMPDAPPTPLPQNPIVDSPDLSSQSLPSRVPAKRRIKKSKGVSGTEAKPIRKTKNPAKTAPGASDGPHVDRIKVKRKSSKLKPRGAMAPDKALGSTSYLVAPPATPTTAQNMSESASSTLSATPTTERMESSSVLQSGATGNVRKPMEVIDVPIHSADFSNNDNHTPPKQRKKRVGIIGKLFRRNRSHLYLHD